MGENESLHVRRFPDGRRFEVVTGDLLRQPVDGIVNAANGELAHGGGVAAVIAAAAGPALVEEGDRLVAARGPVPTGGAVLTGAGRLPFRGVVHAVGPRQGQGDEGRKLESALLASFAIAEGAGWRSLAFPAVNSGIFAVPLEVCASAYAAAADRFFAGPTRLSLLRLVLKEGPLAEHFRALK